MSSRSGARRCSPRGATLVDDVPARFARGEGMGDEAEVEVAAMDPPVPSRAPGRKTPSTSGLTRSRIAQAAQHLLDPRAQARSSPPRTPSPTGRAGAVEEEVAPRIEVVGLRAGKVDAAPRGRWRGGAPRGARRSCGSACARSSSRGRRRSARSGVPSRVAAQRRHVGIGDAEALVEEGPEAATRAAGSWPGREGIEVAPQAVEGLVGIGKVADEEVPIRPGGSEIEQPLELTLHEPDGVEVATLGEPVAAVGEGRAERSRLVGDGRRRCRRIPPWPRSPRKRGRAGWRAARRFAPGRGRDRRRPPRARTTGRRRGSRVPGAARTPPRRRRSFPGTPA